MTFQKYSYFPHNQEVVAMPMSLDFEKRLFRILPRIMECFGTPVYAYDEIGIRETGARVKRAFSGLPGYGEFFAVKALPNPVIMRLMLEMGFGFDCSSIPELILARQVGAGPDQIMFTSNNTSLAEYEEALAHGGCILNLDDLSFVAKVPGRFPKRICIRYNPGPRRQGGGHVFGNPEDQKYGVRHDQIVEAYRLAIERGAEIFGIHTMVISNELDYSYMVETIKMLLGIIEMVSSELGISFEFMNIGGGLGIPYKPEDGLFNIELLGIRAETILGVFKARHGYQPKLFMESGRFMTGPHGVLITRVINRMSKYRELVGVDACMSSLMRPGMYRASGGGYHHITAFGKEGEPTEVVSVVGSLCENNDQFAVDREMPVVAESDALGVNDGGAHAIAMAFQYNGRLRPPEVLLRADGNVELIRRRETVEDLFCTLQFEPQTLRVHCAGEPLIEPGDFRS